MTREDVKGILPEITDEQLNKLLKNIHIRSIIIIDRKNYKAMEEIR